MDVKEKFAQLLNAKRLEREIEENFMRTPQGLRYRPDAGPTKIPHVPKKEQEEMRRMRQRDAQRGVSAENEEGQATGQPSTGQPPAGAPEQANPGTTDEVPPNAPPDFKLYANNIKQYAATNQFAKQEIIHLLTNLKAKRGIIPWKR